MLAEKFKVKAGYDPINPPFFSWEAPNIIPVKLYDFGLEGKKEADQIATVNVNDIIVSADPCHVKIKIEDI